MLIYTSNYEFAAHIHAAKKSIFEDKNVAPLKKSKCHVTSLLPYNSHLPKVAVVERFDCAK